MSIADDAGVREFAVWASSRTHPVFIHTSGPALEGLTHCLSHRAVRVTDPAFRLWLPIFELQSTIFNPR